MESLMQFMVIVTLAPMFILLVVKVLFWTGILGAVGYTVYADKKAEKLEKKKENTDISFYSILDKQNNKPDGYYYNLLKENT